MGDESLFLIFEHLYAIVRLLIDLVSVLWYQGLGRSKERERDGGTQVSGIVRTLTTFINFLPCLI